MLLIVSILESIRYVNFILELLMMLSFEIHT